jgi:hypothetical protein
VTEYEWNEKEAEYEIASGMFTGSMVVVMNNIQLLELKIGKATGLGRSVLIENRNKLCAAYNQLVGFEAYDLKYYSK